MHFTPTAVPVGIAVVALIFVAVVMFLSSQAPKVTFLEEGLQIHGMYGEVYVWDSIEAVKLIEELPNIEMRTNGSALGSNLKGHFRTTEHGPVKLFVNTKKPPFVYLESNGDITIYNLTNAEKTEETYKEILKRIRLPRTLKSATGYIEEGIYAFI